MKGLSGVLKNANLNGLSETVKENEDTEAVSNVVPIESAKAEETKTDKGEEPEIDKVFLEEGDIHELEISNLKIRALMSDVKTKRVLLEKEDAEFRVKRLEHDNKMRLESASYENLKRKLQNAIEAHKGLKRRLGEAYNVSPNQDWSIASDGELVLG